MRACLRTTLQLRLPNRVINIILYKTKQHFTSQFSTITKTNIGACELPTVGTKLAQLTTVF
jgi:hypothetical protein